MRAFQSIADEITGFCNICQQHSVAESCKHASMNTVGERIKAERIAQGIDRNQLAKRTGIGYSTIAELERGGMKTSTQLRLFAEALHVNLAWPHFAPCAGLCLSELA